MLIHHFGVETQGFVDQNDREKAYVLKKPHFSERNIFGGFQRSNSFLLKVRRSPMQIVHEPIFIL